MKTTIAHKEKGLEIAYLFITFLGVACFVGGMRENLFYAICGLLLAIIGVVFAVRYFLLPLQMIVLSCDDHTLILPKGVTVPLGYVKRVSYQRSGNGRVKQNWGRVTISTYLGTYKCDFVANCKDVAEELTRLMYDKKEKRYKIKGKRKL